MQTGLRLYRANFWLCAVTNSTNFANANGNGKRHTIDEIDKTMKTPSIRENN